MTKNWEYQSFFKNLEKDFFLYLTNQQHTTNTGNFYEFYFFAFTEVICCWYSPTLAECYTIDF